MTPSSVAQAPGSEWFHFSRRTKPADWHHGASMSVSGFGIIVRRAITLKGIKVKKTAIAALASR